MKSCFFIQSGIEDQSHWTQKTYLGLIGGSITRRHPTKTPSGHLAQGESQCLCSCRKTTCSFESVMVKEY